MLTPTSETILPTAHGSFTMQSYASNIPQNSNESSDKGPDEGYKESPTLVLSIGLDQALTPIVRIHSECITGEVFSSLKCDCAEQLQASMLAIQEHGCGAIIYLRQEGRGIGIENKLKAYALQDQGLDTIDANLALGLPVDDRDYTAAIEILESLGVTHCELLTNNPKKSNAVQTSTITLVKTTPLHVEASHPACAVYIKTKQERMAHSI